MITTQAKPARIALKNILVATDFSAASYSALASVLPIARRSHSVLHILHVLRRTKIDLLPPAADAEDKQTVIAKENLRQLEGSLSDVPHRVWLREGHVSSVLRELVKAEQIDLLVVGASGKSKLEKFFVGSVAEEILRSAPCPVMTVGPHSSVEPMDSLAQLLYVTRLWEESHSGLQYAIRLAQQNNCRLLLLHVIEQDEPRHPDREWLKDYRRLLRRLLPESFPGLSLEPVLRIEVARDPAARILQVADEIRANLILMDIRPEEDWAAHLQGKVYQVISFANCPVLTVQTCEESAGAVEEAAAVAKVTI